MTRSLALALFLAPFLGACVTGATTHEQRTATVASDVERDLARVDTLVAAARAAVATVEAEDRRGRLQKLLDAAMAERDTARNRLAQYQADPRVELVREAANATSRAQTLARAAERGEDLFALE